MDAQGKVVVEPRFERVSPFADGLARIILDGRPAFIDPSGTVVLRPPFEIVRDFSERLAAVNIGERRDPAIGLIRETGMWGYIDTDGKLALPLKYSQADSFSEGLAAVHGDGRSGFIDRTGKMLFSAVFDVSWGFREGVVLVKSKQEMIYLDRQGRRLPTPKLDDNYHGASFSEGRAAVQINQLWGYIDRSGALVIPAQFREASSFHEGLAAVQPPTPLSAPQRCTQPDGSSYSFTRGFGYIDMSGRMIIPATHEYASDFSEGLARVSSCGQIRYIDRTGKTIISVPYREASSFSGGLAEVGFRDAAGAHRGYIDRTGKLVRRPTN